MVDQQNSLSFPVGGVAVVIGANGAIGSALCAALADSNTFQSVTTLSRGTTPSLDLGDEHSIASAADLIAAMDQPVRLVIDATGFLHGDKDETSAQSWMPEKSWRDINPAHMAHAFAVNAIGPALLMKYFLPLLPRTGKSVFVTLSAKVGSIGDNRLGGWYSYRASKAALNQLVRCAAIELNRNRPDAICVTLHPGTVQSNLSAPFGKAGLNVRTPDEAARDLITVIERLTPSHNGTFMDYRGQTLPW